MDGQRLLRLSSVTEAQPRPRGFLASLRRAPRPGLPTQFLLFPFQDHYICRASWHRKPVPTTGFADVVVREVGSVTRPRMRGGQTVNVAGAPIQLCLFPHGIVTNLTRRLRDMMSRYVCICCSSDLGVSLLGLLRTIASQGC